MSETPETPDGDESPESYLEFVETVVPRADGPRREWYWRHKARNHEELSRSSETYTEERAAADGARLSLGESRISAMSVKRFPLD